MLSSGTISLFLGKGGGGGVVVVVINLVMKDQFMHVILLLENEKLCFCLKIKHIV
jgi:hypothetical protein